jgi:hypothetical protein
MEGEFMRLDITKIDDRIRKLQELKRLLSDTEITNILFECLTANEPESAKPMPPPSPRLPESPDFAANLPDGVESVMNEVLEGARWNKKGVKPA